MTELDLAAAAPDILTRFSALGPLAWVLSAVGVIAASAALIAFGMVLTRLGVAVALLFAHIGKAVRGFGGDLARFIGGFIVSLLLLPGSASRRSARIFTCWAACPASAAARIRCRPISSRCGTASRPTARC